MSFIDNDLPIFFGGLDAVSVSYGGNVSTGYFDSPADPFAVGAGKSSAETQRYCITLPVNAFPTVPTAKQPITVNGTVWKIRERTISEDGRIVSLELMK